MRTKTCKRCSQAKPVSEFYRNRSLVDGYHLYCKLCFDAPRKTREGRAKNVIYMQKRRENPKYKTSYDLANGVSKMLKTAVRLSKLGYSCEELMRHLESQFEPGMTWENYVEVWTIDHIIPVSSPEFDFTSMNDSDCWSLTNLRPMWKGENTKKGKMSEAQLKIENARQFINSL
jgi:hypothetical protein